MPRILGTGDDMRLHIITSLLLIAPCAGALAAQDTTQAQKRMQNQDTLQQANKGRWGGAINDDVVLRQMHRTNLEEIQVGQLAQRNGSSAKVKDFGARLVRDHQAADKKVLSVAKQVGIALPATQDKGRAREQWGRDSTDRQGSMMRRDTTGQADTTSRQGYPQSYQQRGDSTDRGMQDGERTVEKLRSLHGAAFDTAFANAMVKGHERAINLLEMAQGQVQHEEVRSLITSTLPTLREHLQIAQSLAGATTTSSSQYRLGVRAGRGPVPPGASPFSRGDSHGQRHRSRLRHGDRYEADGNPVQVRGPDLLLLLDDLRERVREAPARGARAARTALHDERHLHRTEIRLSGERWSGVRAPPGSA
jgi:putative membrane protein